MIETNCYCDKCKQKIKDNDPYYKIDVHKRKWYPLPEDVDRSASQQKLHLCENCMKGLNSFLRGK